MATDINITEPEYEELKKHDYCVVTEFENTSTGYRWGKLSYYGDKGECKIAAETCELLVLPNYVKCIGKQVVAVGDLIPPVET